MPSSSPAELDTALRQIARLDWSELMLAQHAVEPLFGALDVGGLIDGLKPDLDEIVDVERSVEKTTHYKWFLGEGSSGRFQVWLHEYKPKTHRREGHATVAHNHRFWLTSLILRGGFTDTRYERTAEGDRRLIAPIASRVMRTGDTMVLAPDEIHALGELQDGTLSLIVQSKPVRSFSEVFENGTVRRYADLDAKLADLRASL